MADTLLLRALKSQPKNLNISNKNLTKVPKLIGQLKCILQIVLKNNKISSLPEEFGELTQLQVLNLGNNLFEDLPVELKYCVNLIKLHVFGNQLNKLNRHVLGGLYNLTFLNLNNNYLKVLPREIFMLRSLTFLSLDENQLVELPFELCAITPLKELHVASNQLSALPLELGYLRNLEKLHAQKNKLKELPESIGKCYKLRILDVAANELRIFPTEFSQLPLKEMYCEENPILQHIPVHSVQEEEVLSLKEVSARFVMRELKDRFSLLRRTIRHYPDIREMLAKASKCAVCGEAFLNTWLECVRFIDGQRHMNTSNTSGMIPVRALLCSYKCFNSPNHEYYGVAFP